MAFPKDCFQGGGPAYITVDNLPRKFREIPGFTMHPDVTVALMNNAFKMYHDAFHALDAKLDKARGTRAQAGWSNLRDQVQADVRSAAKSAVFTGGGDYHGVGTGWQSLKIIFEDLEATGGVLGDDSTAGHGDCIAPPGILEFYNQMIARGKEITTCKGDFDKWKSNVDKWKTNKNWESLGTYLGMGGTVIDKVGPKLWALAGVDGARAAAFNATAVKWWGYGAQVKGMMDTHIAVESQGEANSKVQLWAEATAFFIDATAGSTPMGMFVSAYANVIRDVPKAMTFFEEYAKRNAQYIKMASGR